jgi:Domain of unknown function (DUF4190)
MTATPPQEPDRGPAPPPTPPPQPATPAYSAGASSTPKTNGLAIASLVLGIIPCTGVTSILAIVFGFIARNQIEKSGGTQQGSGMALAGIILGFVWIGISVIWWIAILAS